MLLVKTAKHEGFFSVFLGSYSKIVPRNIYTGIYLTLLVLQSRLADTPL